MAMNLAALAPIIVVAVGFAVFCVVDIARATSTRHMPKWAWIVACVVSIPLGGIFYLLMGRDDR